MGDPVYEKTGNYYYQIHLTILLHFKDHSQPKRKKNVKLAVTNQAGKDKKLAKRWISLINIGRFVTEIQLNNVQSVQNETMQD